MDISIHCLLLMKSLMWLRNATIVCTYSCACMWITNYTAPLKVLVAFVMIEWELCLALTTAMESYSTKTASAGTTLSLQCKISQQCLFSPYWCSWRTQCHISREQVPSVVWGTVPCPHQKMGAITGYGYTIPMTVLHIQCENSRAVHLHCHEEEWCCEQECDCSIWDQFSM